MAEILLLKQQIEFLQLELEEAKSRENQLKSMYDSMLRSFSMDSPKLTVKNTQTSTSVELKSAEEKHTQERIRIKLKYKEKIRNLTKENEQLLEDKNELELKVNDCIQNQETLKNLFQKEIISLRNQRTDSERKANENYDTMQKIISRKNEIISNLKSELEELKKENAEEISRITEDTNRSLSELKAIYEKEKVKVDNQETIETLKNEFKNLQGLIKTLENSEMYLKEQVKIKDDHIEKISRKLRIKASEDSKSTDFKDFTFIKESLSEKLIEKDIELSKLKKIIGELRIEIANGATKPPIHSPKAFRSMTFIHKLDNSETESFINERSEDTIQLKKFERMVSQALLLQCEKCLKSYNKDLFYEHILNCECESERNSPDDQEKMKELEKHLETLKLSLANMKTQRDKSRIESEKLLMQLKQAKVDLAVSEENFEDRLMDLKFELKKSIELLLKLKKSLSDNFKNEIDLMIKRVDKHFGGRLLKSFILSH
jgi:hypothetical protein